MNKNDYNENVAQGLTVDGSSKIVQITGTHISRRSFAKGVSRMIGLGALSHFSLLAGKVLAEESNYAGDDCPGELPIPTVDACYPGDSDDTCSLPSPDNAE